MVCSRLFKRVTVMKLDLQEKPRVFKVNETKIMDYGKIHLREDEMVSFVTQNGRECDFTAKSWGFYLGPSLNSRLKNQGFKVALVLNEQGQLYVNAVEKDKIELFNKYLTRNQNSKILCWLDEWIRDESIEITWYQPPKRSCRLLRNV